MRSVVAVLALGLLAGAPVSANDSRREPIDRTVPALPDGTRMALNGVERAILDACARRKLTAMVLEPGVILARYQHHRHSFEVRIVYTDSAYSIHYESSGRVRAADGQSMASLAGNIDVSLDAALDRLEMAMNRMKDARPRKSNRINPRNAA